MNLYNIMRNCARYRTGISRRFLWSFLPTPSAWSNIGTIGCASCESTIGLTHPPREDSLILKARNKAKAEAALIKQHPELLAKGGRKK